MLTFKKKEGFKVFQIMEIMIKSKYWVIEWFALDETYVILQILCVFAVVLLLIVTFHFNTHTHPRPSIPGIF